MYTHPKYPLHSSYQSNLFPGNRQIVSKFPNFSIFSLPLRGCWLRNLLFGFSADKCRDLKKRVRDIL